MRGAATVAPAESYTTNRLGDQPPSATKHTKSERALLFWRLSF